MISVGKHKYGFNALEVYFIRMGELIVKASKISFKLNWLQQVKKTETVSVDESLEHIPIGVFYEKLRDKLTEKDPNLEISLKDFLTGNWSCHLSSIYLISLVHFSEVP